MPIFVSLFLGESQFAVRALAKNNDQNNSLNN